MSGEAIKNHSGFIWSVADLLRGVYKQSEYGRVILPLTVLRRLDCVLEPTKAEVLETLADLPETLRNREPLLQQVAGETFVNMSRHTFHTLLGDPDNVAGNLRNYIAGFSESARDIVDKFNFDVQIDRLDDHNLLYLVVSKFAELDLSPAAVSNLEMGYLYEELIRKFSELSNETAGEHFTPREVIRLMVNLLFADDDKLLTRPGVWKTLLDPACGTGGMLAVAEDYLRELNPQARLLVFGQEVNAETYATCRADMLIKGADADNIRFGNSFDDDQHQGQRFDYLLANPPFGVEWKMVADTIRDEHAAQGFAGRFGAGLPRINDGSFLFLQHMISKMKRPDEGGARLAIVFNGSPLFTGAAGSGESEIRRWIIESDMLEAVVALPDQLFYNTGISTYFWVVTNRKAPRRRGKVQLIDARESFTKMRKSLGQKRKEISAEQITELTRLYGAFEEGPRVKIFPNESFGFLRITMERPLRLRWEITDDTLAAVEANKKVAKLDHPRRDALLEALSNSRGSQYTTEKSAKAAVQEALASADIDAPAALVKAVIDALAVRDPKAPVITDRAGNPKPDPGLRDNENVPLPESSVAYEPDTTARLQTIEYGIVIDDYLDAEVHPYVPDAWHDPAKTKIGYEIPLTRHFYTYTPPRYLHEIDAEIRQHRNTLTLEACTGQMLDARESRQSSLHWAEEIPSHWQEVLLRLVASVGSGHTPSRNHPEWWLDCTIPWITTGDVWQMRSDDMEYIRDTLEKVSHAGIANSSAVIHPAGTVVLSRTASPGYSAIMATDMATSQDFVTWTCGPLLRPRFLLLCLRAMRNDLLGRLAMGSTHKTIYMPDIDSIRIPLPPISEQDQIVEIAWSRLRVIDHAISKLERQIMLLSERRQSLVASVVTGEMPVPSVVA